MSWIPPLLCLLLALCAGPGRAAAPGVGAPGAAAPDSPFRTPYLPASDSAALQDVPAAGDPAVPQMRRLRGAFEAAPDLAAALKLADAYIDYSRQIGDAHYAGYAEAVIAPWVTSATPPAAALLTQATILQYRHQFSDARRLLQRSLDLEPRNAQAWLTTATLDIVQGDYPGAAKACAQVTNSAGLELGAACLGNLRSYTGHAQQSLALLRQAQAAGGGVTAAYRAWIEGLLAESAERLGQWPSAEAHYRAALELLPRDNFLLVAYADFLLDRDRPQEVLALLAGHEQSDTAFLRLALALSALHRADAGRYTWIMGARFEALQLRGSDYFGREEARFALGLQHDPQTALDMALRNWQVQRAPWDARVLLEAALAAHRPQDAAAVVEFIRTTHLEDPLVVALVNQVAAQLSGSAAPISSTAAGGGGRP